MATNFNPDDEQRRLQEENLHRLRDLKLSELSEEDEETGREELKKYDELERQIQTLDGTDKQTVDEYQWEIDDHNNEINKVDKELDEIQAQLDKSEAKQKSHANELKILTDAFASLTSEIEQVQQELQKLREQQHDLTIEHDHFQSILFKQQQILNDEDAKMMAIEQRIALLNNQKHRFKEQQNKLNQILTQSETGLLSLEEQIKNLDIELQQLKKNEKNLQIQLEESKRAVEQIVQRLKQTQENKADYVKNIQRQEDLMHQLEREQQKINIQIQHLKNSIERIQESIRQNEQKEHDLMRFIEQKNQEKQIAEQEQREANNAVQQAQEILQALDMEINTLRSQLAQFIQENNQLEQQCRQATNNLEETKHQLELAQKEVERLRNQLRDIDQQLNDKKAELTQAQDEERNLNDLLQIEKQHLQEIDAIVVRLEEELRQAKITLNAAVERLNQLKEYLRQQEQWELKMQQAYETQVIATNQAQDRANEADRGEREAKQAADKAVREQKQAEAVVGRLESGLNDYDIALALALVALASTLLVPIAGEIAAIPILVNISTLRVAIAKLKSNLNAARNGLLQANSVRDRALNLHQTPITEKQRADEILAEERRKLATCKRNLDQQIQAKNAAKREVKNQNTVVTTATDQLKDVQHRLTDSQKQQTQQRIKVHNVEIQVKEKTAQVTQLKAEREALESRQKQTQDALNQADNNFEQATKRYDQAKTNLEELRNRQEAKATQVEDTKKLVDTKQGEFENARVDYRRKENMAHKVKNKVDMINQDMTVATQSKQELTAQIQFQMGNLLSQETKSNDLIYEKEKLQTKLQQTEEEKKNLENQVQYFNKQLDVQNQTMMDKTRQMHTILANLKNKKQERIQIEVQHTEQTEHVKRIQTQIHEYQEALTVNQADLTQAQIDKDKQENTQKVAKDNVENMNQNIRRIRNDLNSVSDVMHAQEKIYDEREQRHNTLTHEIENSQAIQTDLGQNVQHLNDQWISKRMLITNAVNTVKDLRQNISKIKSERRTRLQEEKQQMVVNNVQVNHQKNFNNNTRLANKR